MLQFILNRLTAHIELIKRLVPIVRLFLMCGARGPAVGACVWRPPQPRTSTCHLFLEMARQQPIPLQLTVQNAQDLVCRLINLACLESRSNRPVFARRVESIGLVLH